MCFNNPCSFHSIEDLRSGEHICFIYETGEEHRAIVTPFLRRGLENNEKVFYITDSHSAEDILKYLRYEDFPLQSYLDKGQFKIFSSSDVYLSDGFFDPDRMISLLQAETEKALKEGYNALRITGEIKSMPDSHRLIEYEAKLDLFFSESRCIAICQYDRKYFSGEILLNVLKSHPIAIVGTQIYDNCYYVPPEKMSGPDSALSEFECRLEHMSEHKKTAEELMKYREKLEELVAARTEELKIVNETLQFEIVERKEMEARLYYKRAILDGINRIFHEAIVCETEEELAKKSLSVAEELTGSSSGFIGEINETDHLDTIALSARGWQNCRVQSTDTVKLINNMAICGIWGEVIKKGKSVVINDPAGHPARSGVPAGHPPVVNFLGVPLKAGERTVGLIALANKKIDYKPEDRQAVERLAAAFSEALKRKRAEKAIKEYSFHLEDMVGERTRELQEAQEELIRKEKLSLLGQMAGSVGHEIKNPLGVISNAVYFLKMVLSDGDPTVKEYLELINSEVYRVNKIISDLGNFSRAKVISEKEEISVSTIVSSVLKRKPVSESVKLKLSIPSLLPSVFADPQHMEQILLNLIRNACQAMPGGGNLTIEAVEEDGYLSISVKDTGCGISPKNMGKIFDPLFTTKSRGIGLGLAICKKLAEAGGGKLEVRSEEGRGSIFTLFIPLKKVML